jgi:hypothetical protein
LPGLDLFEVLRRLLTVVRVERAGELGEHPGSLAITAGLGGRVPQRACEIETGVGELGGSRDLSDIDRALRPCEPSPTTTYRRPREPGANPGRLPPL